jgi:hypothetical protein
VVNHELRNFPRDYENDARTRGLVELEIMILLAGGIARAKFQGHRRRLGAGQDLRDANRLADCICGDLDERIAFVRWLGERTPLLLNQPRHWRAVQDTARALLEHKELTGRAARRIFQAAEWLYRQDAAARVAMEAAVGWGE